MYHKLFFKVSCQLIFEMVKTGDERLVNSKIYIIVPRYIWLPNLEGKYRHRVRIALFLRSILLIGDHAIFYERLKAVVLYGASGGERVKSIIIVSAGLC